MYNWSFIVTCVYISIGILKMVKLILQNISVGNIILQTFLCLKDFSYKATYSIPLRFEWQQSDHHLLLYMSVD